MKYLGYLFLIVLFAGCQNPQSGDIEITGTAPGVTLGNVMVKDFAKNTVFRVDVEAGKFNIKDHLRSSGYYKFIYASKATKGGSREVEVYLEPGTYSINIDQDHINDYPSITSSSKLQTQLSAYNAISDIMRHESRKKVVAIHEQMTDIDKASVKSREKDDKISALQAQELAANQVDPLAVFNIFMDRFPNNDIGPHLMMTMDYQNDPVTYYKIYQSFSNDAKNSDEGKELGEKLKELNKLAPGNPAPAIAGTTADGKEVNIKALNKKVILLDFWRSTNGSSRDNHQTMISELLPKFGNSGLGIVSVSFDTDKDKWTGAIAMDKMDWPQLSDLKGDDSPNGQTWGIKSIPAYYLLDGQGRIITRVAEFAEVTPAIQDALSKK
jgi:peroxiredoxin